MNEEALHHVVPENVAHELAGVWQDLAEDTLLLLAVSSLKLDLNELGSGLITTELDNVIEDVL